MGKVILITGINGFVGQSLAKALSNKDYSIIGVDLQNGLASGLTEYSNIHFHKMNMVDESSIGFLKSYKPDIIIHLAGLLPKSDSMRDQTQLFSANMKGTFHMLEVARVCNSQFMFSSTGLVYGNQNNPYHEDMKYMAGDYYAFTKSIAEQQVEYFGRIFGIEYTIFRMSVLYGPRQLNSMFIPSLISNLVEGRDFKMTKGEQLRDFLFIDDCVSAFVAAVEKNVSGFSMSAPVKHLKLLILQNRLKLCSEKKVC